MQIPVYLILGFLDAGKSQFINGVLADGLAADHRTLLLRCEEGDVEYDPSLMKNVTVASLEDEEELTPMFLRECEKKYRPRQVLVEYNGMWQLETLLEHLPPSWFLAQTFTFVEAGSFDIYSRNMGQLTMEKVKTADVLVFNRCTPELAESLRARNLRMVNRKAEIFLEYMDGTDENYLTGEECPFDLEQEVIDIPPEDFGVWYVDVMDHPQRYEGKRIHTKLVAMYSPKYKVCCPGRFAMVCCANDVAFLGLVARGEGLERYKNKTWLDATFQITVEEHPAYQGPGPFMNILEATPCERAEPELLSY
ncbi:MAG: hypothetical protein HFF05_06010 [Oscillospiraceae bacterium]|nr:hypothetical protein [Oscillospiraceae bacterium]